MIDSSEGFTLVRTFAATPGQLWAAWTEPDQMAQWFHPLDATTPRDSVAVDLRVGGRYRYAMVNTASGERVDTGGVYLELVPDQRLVFTWGEPDADPAETPVVTVTFAAVDQGTRMTFELRGVQGHPGDGFFYDGWVDALDSLDHFLAR